MGRGVYSIDSLSGIFVLVLDTDKERRNLITGILRYCRALVTPAETAQGALAIMRLLKPDVIVVDVSPPEEGALDFIRSVRALQPEEGGAVTAIAVGDESASAEVARTRGFDGYLPKPIDPWRLCQLVSDLVTR
jgi:CheY-like chemotaxis protein